MSEIEFQIYRWGIKHDHNLIYEQTAESKKKFFYELTMKTIKLSP